jgi:hypothetical protein
MAWTVTVVDKTVLGNKRVISLNCLPDAATQAVATGLQVIDWFSVGVQSASTAAFKIYANKDASGAVANGTLGCSGFVSGDNLFINVYGR